MNRKKILLTGGLGFIAYNLVVAIKSKYNILLIDNLLDNIDFTTKKERLKELVIEENSNLCFEKIDFTDFEKIYQSIKSFQPDLVIHLGALTGVKNSIQNSDSYLKTNVNGLQNILKSCSMNGIENIFYSSSSSVYGNMEIGSNQIQPISFYGTTKYMGELLCENYAKLSNFNITSFRFFTVYGPSNRKDMAFYKFYNAIKAGKEISLNNNGEMKRAFTYVKDVVSVLELFIEKSFDNKLIGYKSFSLGNPNSNSIKEFALELTKNLKSKAKINFSKANREESNNTFASNTALNTFLDTNFKFTPIEIGIKETVNWFINKDKNL